MVSATEHNPAHGQVPMKHGARPHPLDPLTPAEIIRTSQVIRKKKSNAYVFNTITLQEPPKSVMVKYLGWDKSGPAPTTIAREAFVNLIQKDNGHCFEAIVNLEEGTITRFEHIPGVQPILTMDEMFDVETLVINDPLVHAECRALGITDMKKVFCDPWAIGHLKGAQYDGVRLLQALMYYRTRDEDNQYAHPLDFFPIIDANQMKIIEIERIKPRDSAFERPTIPQMEHNFLPEFFDENHYRKDVKPVQVLQPEGVSFTVNGNEISWQKWNMRISFNYREGLVIHNVNYKDGHELRPLFYRMSMAEMVVPYADPASPHNRKHAFDVGEYGLGLCSNSLALGCDCLGTIKYFDATFNHHNGQPYDIPQAICLHEEDHGILFKHTDYRNNRAHTVRGRRLVISHIVTVANYDYALYWYFYQDGTIQYEVKATGEVNTHVLAEDETPGPYGTMVAPQINAQHHQHFFAMRIDPMIDGLNNTMVQQDVVPSHHDVGSAENPYGNAFYCKSTVLKDTHQAQCVANPQSNRTWKITNLNRIHPYTKTPVSYKLYSMHTPPLLAQPGSVVAGRAKFATKNLWVTPYDDHQLFPAGFYTNQSHPDHELGLPEWTKEKASIENKDIVAWFTFGVTHVVRAEDFPVMPVEKCGFMMKPVNFFLGNPALDVPPTNKCANKSVYAFENGHGQTNGQTKGSSCGSKSNRVNGHDAVAAQMASTHL